jgi:hypothetical protein
VGALLLTAWAQRHALPGFFNPDDLVHLQQAAGLKPILASPFRILSQVFYFKLMFATVGLDPRPYHLVSLLVHLLNVGLLFGFVRSCGASPGVAGLASSLFGTFPLFFPLLASAVGINDELALGLTLVALMLVRRDGTWPIVAAGVAFLTAILCKESVLSLPLLTLVLPLPARHRWVRRSTLLGLGLAFAATHLLIPPLGSTTYATQFGPNVFHNLMTYTAWGVNLARPIPDLVSSFDPTAWRVGVVVYGVMLAAWIVSRRDRPSIGLGVAWWVAGLLPVLILRFQTYRHYLYPALPGLALIAATVVASVASALTRRRGASDAAAAGPGAPAGRVVVAILAACAIVYAGRADTLIAARMSARIPGTQLALDPGVRREEVARNALASLARYLPAQSGLRVAIFSPAGTGRVMGARTGRQYADSAATAYSLIEASLDGGGAVRLFFPALDSIAFIERWTPGVAGYELFLASQDGHLLPAGSGPDGHTALGRWLLAQGWHAQVRDYLSEVVLVYPEDADIRLLYASALFKLGDRTLALEHLDRITKTAPDTDAGKAAATLIEAAAADANARVRNP